MGVFVFYDDEPMSGAIIHETDLSLLRRFTQAGDHAIFAEIIRRYAGLATSLPIHTGLHRISQNFVAVFQIELYFNVIPVGFDRLHADV